MRGCRRSCRRCREEIASFAARSSICARKAHRTLTGLGNRRYFITSLERTIAECRAAEEPLTLLMADVDHFKAINENFGHIVGDRVLRFIAMV